MLGARRFFSQEKQVFLVSFSLTISRKSAQIQKPTKYYSSIDGLSGKFLKNGANNILAKPISKICNLSIKYSIFPTNCQIAKLKPLCKKGSTALQKLSASFNFIQMKIRYLIDFNKDLKKLFYRFVSFIFKTMKLLLALNPVSILV